MGLTPSLAPITRWCYPFKLSQRLLVPAAALVVGDPTAVQNFAAHAAFHLLLIVRELGFLGPFDFAGFHLGRELLDVSVGSQL